jgi:hypothetical protein
VVTVLPDPELALGARAHQLLPLLGQFASPDLLSPRLAAAPLSSNGRVARSSSALNVHPRTPRAADLARA